MRLCDRAPHIDANLEPLFSEVAVLQGAPDLAPCLPFAHDGAPADALDLGLEIPRLLRRKPLPFHAPRRDEEMRMPVGALALRITRVRRVHIELDREALRDEVFNGKAPRELDPILRRELRVRRQRQHDLAGKLRVLAPLRRLGRIPQGGRVRELAAGAFRQQHRVMLRRVAVLEIVKRPGPLGVDRLARVVGGQVRGHHVACELASQLNMDWVHAPAGIPRGIKPVKRQWWLDFEEPIDLDDEGDTGVALLTRLPMTDVTRLDLPWQECPWRPRLAMAATISVGKHEVRILNAHVDPHAAVDGQLAQLEAIAAQADATTLPTIVLGDFNTLSRQKCIETREFLEARGFSTPFPTGTATWRTTVLKMHADWIFVRGVKIERWGVAKPLNVSDHWPIWAEVVV